MKSELVIKLGILEQGFKFYFKLRLLLFPLFLTRCFSLKYKNLLL